MKQRWLIIHEYGTTLYIIIVIISKLGGPIPIGKKHSPPKVPVKKPIVPNVPLPMLNWLPIKNPKHTIFKVSTLVILSALMKMS